MTKPPSHAPPALAMLRAEWFSAAANVCASSATSMRRVWSAGTKDVPETPTAKTKANAAQGFLDTAAKMSSIAATSTSPTAMARTTLRSAIQPPSTFPVTMPMP